MSRLYLLSKLRRAFVTIPYELNMHILIVSLHPIRPQKDCFLDGVITANCFPTHERLPHKYNARTRPGQLSQPMYLNVNGTMKWLFFLIVLNMCMQKHDLRLLYLYRPYPKASSLFALHLPRHTPKNANNIQHNKQMTYLEIKTSQLPPRWLVHKPRPIQLFGFGREICFASASARLAQSPLSLSVHPLWRTQLPTVQVITQH